VSLVNSDDSWVTESHLVSSSVGDNPVFLSSSSDGLGSSVEVEPLSVVPWLVVVDSQSVVVVTNVLMPEQGSVAAHSGSNLESDSVTKDWSVIDSTLLVEPPSLVGTIVAVPEDDVSVMSVGVSMDIKALSSVVLEVSAAAVVPSDSVLVKTLVWSGSSSNSNSEVCTELVTNAVSSSSPGSDGLGSSVEGPPLLVVGWVVVLDSESELVATNVLVPEQSSVISHS
jgi:hypothetical protein